MTDPQRNDARGRFGPGAAPWVGPPVRWSFVLAGTGVLLVVIVRAAWLCDDAYITLRTVDNVVNGFGLRWNVVERVQTFTHPAWLLLVTPFYAITREAYFTVIGLQLALAALTIGLCFRLLAASGAAIAIGVALLVSSRAFLDFSTSGLENGLAHLLIVIFLVLWLRDRMRPGPLTLLGLISAGLMLCRLDLAALIAPLLAMSLWPVKRDRVVSFLVGVSPFVAWELFSLVYYGQLVPNTALAKLPPGVPASELAAQGLRYLAATWHFDPVTPALALTATVAVAGLGGRAGRAIALGVVLHVLSIVMVGGDFMSGRFLTPALVMAVAGLVSMRGVPPSGNRLVAAGAVVALIAGASTPGSAVRTSADFGPSNEPGVEFARHGVTDERRFYNPTLGLLPVLQGLASPEAHGWSAEGLRYRANAEQPEFRAREASNVGLFGFFAGPRVYVVDRYALTDPFLARLPPKPGWRVGHYERVIPPGYMDSRRAGRNLLTDPDLRRLYDQVDLLTQAAVWRRDRLSLVVSALRPGGLPLN
jgi:arabinofuranosyltransferase